ncbi:prepilin-type N-terminal cleavage/methylation domain-containing protein [Zooshikella harenae]|uniref:Prepilin-type N-terminal cleavage/methylation domain-containing protein n=1 Tax=Zooshikella harenae TaxID=2827238 RepID=A0ABS5Z7X4_9GAMM|nr:prepilin-type N-terminal cleavage/methylation domain-containing protein [Zooshikella harenae]MBU2710151.1 prepilin-type N-terminal cleavage/methylation domain-containing protein [Zooshikella harenae]
MKFQRGVTLIELMIALALSVMLLMGITKIFSLGKQTLMSAEGQMQHEEAGRLGLSYIRQAIRNAHYVPFDDNNVPIELSQLPGFPHNQADCEDKDLNPNHCNTLNQDANDSLTVSYIYQNEEQFSCAQEFRNTDPIRIAVSFFIDSDEDVLKCKAYYYDQSINGYVARGNTVELVKNIIGLKLAYYYEDGVNTGLINTINKDSPAGMAVDTRWEKINGVKIGVVVTSSDRGLNPSASVNVFGNRLADDSDKFNIPDRYNNKVNKVYITTVQAINYGAKRL